jgi:endo-1,4-beta-xylanase
MLESSRSRCLVVAMMLLGVASCASDPTLPPIESIPSTPRELRVPTLRQIAMTRGLRVGAAADRLFREDADGARFKEVLSREFSVLAPENDMKLRRLQPSRGVFTFARADSLVAFAEANGMQVRGHTLVWHQALPAWLTAGHWTPEDARTVLTDHVTTVVDHFRGRIVAWDVVNEAISDDGTLRPSIWSDLIGRDYIEIAFRAAHAADPQALLFYNDHDIEGINAKSDSAYALISGLLAAGVPIHGIGLQAHFVVGRLPSRQSMADNIARFAALGLKVHFTELDIRVPQPSTSTHRDTQADNYQDVVTVCLQNVACEMIVTWGVTDRDSWISRQDPGWGEPLLFDRSYRPKPAYWRIHDLLSGG